MKNFVMFAVLIALSVLSCKKDDVISPVETQVEVVSIDSVSVASKTAAYPVQRSVYAKINNYIGGYLEALPTTYATYTTKKFPLLIFLHGMNEKGNGTTQLSLVGRYGIPHMITTKVFPATVTVSGVGYQFIVISPQFKVWPQPAYINDVVNYAIAHYRVDASRIYITGNSMGGGGAWDYARTYPTRVAAVVPMAGASNPNIQKATPIAGSHVPVWAFNNSGDPTVPVSWTNSWVTFINSLHPSPAARKTIFTASSHDCWTKASNPAYRETYGNIYEWMLRFKR